MTTVGYGDITPITPLGRFVAVFAMFSGIIIVALPITVIGANFEKQFEKQFFTDELVGQVTAEDGSVNYPKLMELFKQLDQRGNLLVPIPKDEAALQALVAEYDVQGKGKLDQEDWASFILDCVCEAHEFTAVTINKVQSPPALQARAPPPHPLTWARGRRPPSRRACCVTRSLLSAPVCTQPARRRPPAASLALPYP